MISAIWERRVVQIVWPDWPGWLEYMRKSDTNAALASMVATRALDMAVALRQPPEDCIHHTDRGSQYCSNEYQKRLSKYGFKVSPLLLASKPLPDSG
jgi:hypothetical protein